MKTCEECNCLVDPEKSNPSLHNSGCSMRFKPYQVVKQLFDGRPTAYAILWALQKNGKWLSIIIHQTERTNVKTHSIQFMEHWKISHMHEIPEKFHDKINEVANKLQKKEQSPLLSIIY